MRKRCFVKFTLSLRKCATVVNSSNIRLSDRMTVHILKYVTLIFESNLIFPQPAGYLETDALKKVIHIYPAYHMLDGRLSSFSFIDFHTLEVVLQFLTGSTLQ